MEIQKKEMKNRFFKFSHFAMEILLRIVGMIYREFDIGGIGIKYL